MLPVTRIIGNDFGYVCIYNNFIPNPLFCQTLRWKRKPIWLPTAKSKVFRVPKKPVIPLEEKLELQRLYNNYRTVNASIIQYCKDVVAKSQVTLDHEYLQKLEDEDFERCSTLNDKWNEEVAKIREIRLQKEREADIAYALEKMERVDAELRKKQEDMDTLIRKAKLERVTFITEDKIDQAIEAALQNVVNYDKVLDIKGNVFEVKTLERGSASQPLQPSQ